MLIIYVIWASNSLNKVTKWGHILYMVLNFEDQKHLNVQKWKNLKTVTFLISI